MHAQLTLTLHSVVNIVYLLYEEREGQQVCLSLAFITCTTQTKLNYGKMLEQLLTLRMLHLIVHSGLDLWKER